MRNKTLKELEELEEKYGDDLEEYLEEVASEKAAKIWAKRKEAEPRYMPLSGGEKSRYKFSKKERTAFERSRTLAGVIETYDKWYRRLEAENESLRKKCAELEGSMFEKTERIMNLEDKLKELENVRQEKEADTGSPAAYKAAERADA